MTTQDPITTAADGNVLADLIHARLTRRSALRAGLIGAATAGMVRFGTTPAAAIPGDLGATPVPLTDAAPPLTISGISPVAKTVDAVTVDRRAAQRCADPLG